MNPFIQFFKFNNRERKTTVKKREVKLAESSISNFKKRRENFITIFVTIRVLQILYDNQNNHLFNAIDIDFNAAISILYQ